MKQYKIWGALGGGFGGVEMLDDDDCEIVNVKNENEAINLAERKAREEYESYEGMHGVRSTDEIMEEDEVDYETALEIYNDEVESWIDFRVEYIGEA